MGVTKFYFLFLGLFASVWFVVYAAVAPCTEHGGTEEWCNSYQLHWAAQAADKQEVLNLLSNGFRDINQRTDPGLSTPLHAAASAGRADMAKLLISRGAIVDLPTKKGETPLDRAKARYCTLVDPDYSVCRLGLVDYDGTIKVLQGGCSTVGCRHPLKCVNNVCLKPTPVVKFRSYITSLLLSNRYFNSTVGEFWRSYRQY